MTQILADNAETIDEAYREVKHKLTIEEQAVFDKAIELMKIASKLNSPRVRALDAALTLGLSAISLHPLALEQLFVGTMTLLAKCIMADRVFKADPRFNQ